MIRTIFKVTKLTFSVSVLALSNYAFANDVSVFPTELTTSEYSNASIPSHGGDLATDDLSNKVSTIVLPAHDHLPVELVAEMEDVAIEQGVTLSRKENMYFWAEDNMWLSKNGSKVFRPFRAFFSMNNNAFIQFVLVNEPQSPLASLEGHHSQGFTKSQGVSDRLLELANGYAESTSAELVNTFSIIDGGNMLVGKREDGSQYVLVGRDAVLQTALMHSRFEQERAIAKRQQNEQAGGYNLSFRFSKGRYTVVNSDPEIDRLLLEAANLLPARSTLQEQLDYAKAVRARVETIFPSENDVLREGQTVNLNQVKAKVQERYETLFRGRLPAEFDVDKAVMKAYGQLKIAATATSDFDLSLIDKKLHSLSSDPAMDQHLATMLSQGGYIRKELSQERALEEGRRLRAMIEIVHDVMAQELGVSRNDLVVLTQPGFHIDMYLRPLENGKVLINDFGLSQQFLKDVLANDVTISEEERVQIHHSIESLKYNESRFTNVYKNIHNQLIEANLIPIKTPGVFQVGRRNVNWMNGIMGNGNTPFFITNASSVPALNKAFEAWVQKLTPNLAVYFVGKSLSSYSGLNQAEDLLDRSGGLDCITVHHE
ncbi:hypothetical protein HC752_05735 [Vibrio sp. S9_S30]|uniref:hypothetical protein n=1 Tax=Vibrio sp. S9_S30 TaxID=2720226 RepID=UPI0016807098|nr:hypothetical protein [Vibrio sp. S9_S30]MBD1556430.1 hypothetical protein [Vibrio sp. S9_S30]